MNIKVPWFYGKFELIDTEKLLNYILIKLLKIALRIKTYIVMDI
jgi:hypothetical protein